jgi:hypothetical protein
MKRIKAIRIKLRVGVISYVGPCVALVIPLDFATQLATVV